MRSRLILDEMCRLYGKFASYLRRVLCKTRLIFPRINGPIVNEILKRNFYSLIDSRALMMITVYVPSTHVWKIREKVF